MAMKVWVDQAIEMLLSMNADTHPRALRHDIATRGGSAFFPTYAVTD